MSQPHGYMVILDPSAPTPVKEWDTITCCHCQQIVRVKADPGGFCLRCMKGICGTCADKDCTPFEKWLEAQEERARFRRQLGV